MSPKNSLKKNSVWIFSGVQKILKGGASTLAPLYLWALLFSFRIHQVDRIFSELEFSQEKFSLNFFGELKNFSGCSRTLSPPIPASSAFFTHNDQVDWIFSDLKFSQENFSLNFLAGRYKKFLGDDCAPVCPYTCRPCLSSQESPIRLLRIWFFQLLPLVPAFFERPSPSKENLKPL